MRILAELLGRIARSRPQPAPAAVPASTTPHPRRNPPHPANVPGPFYVEDGCCLACGIWEDEAEGLLAWLPDANRRTAMSRASPRPTPNSRRC